MKNPSRRSFIKKSTAAAIAATNVSVFSGLINASEGGGGTGSGTGGTTGWFGTTGSGTTAAVQVCHSKLNPQTYRNKVTDENGVESWWCADKVECRDASGSAILSNASDTKWFTDVRRCVGSACDSLPIVESFNPYCIT